MSELPADLNKVVQELAPGHKSNAYEEMNKVQPHLKSLTAGCDDLMFSGAVSVKDGISLTFALERSIALVFIASGRPGKVIGGEAVAAARQKFDDQPNVDVDALVRANPELRGALERLLDAWLGNMPAKSREVVTAYILRRASAAASLLAP
jgi:hypothetical protein